MTFVRYPEATQTIYAELLDQATAASSPPFLGVRRGSFVSKEIRGRRYWYLQRLDAGIKRQIYIGAESPRLLELLDEARNARSEASATDERLRELAAMAVAGGMTRTAPAVGAVIGLLADLGVFNSGGLLVGTHALAAVGAMLGVRFDDDVLRTQDIDIAHRSIAVAVEPPPEADLLAELKRIDSKFFEVPAMDRGKPSASFAVRGKDLRVDFLTPAPGRGETPVPIRPFGIAAQPLRNLGYLMEERERAVLLARDPVLVAVPSPARLALHKLWTAAQRPVSEQAKRRKDLRQARAVIEVLLEDRPGDLRRAMEASRAYRGMISGIRASAKQLGSVGEGVLGVS